MTPSPAPQTADPKIYVGADTNLRVDFVPEHSGEAAYWVVDTRMHRQQRGGPVHVERAGGDDWAFGTPGQPVPVPPPQYDPYVLTVTGGVPQVTSAHIGMAILALGGFAVAKWLGASWAVAMGAAFGLPIGLLGIAYLTRPTS